MYAYGTVCLLRAGQPRRAGAAAKSGQFVGQFSWVTGDPIVVKGLTYLHIIVHRFDSLLASVYNINFP